eukprot:scaffold48783_cov70-Phaeocystis_antarctica.AAC.5
MTPTRRPKSMLPTGSGRRSGHEHSDRTTDTRSQERMARARVLLVTFPGGVDGLCGVLVIVSSRHGPCSGPGRGRHAPRARARRAWVRGGRVWDHGTL